MSDEWYGIAGLLGLVFTALMIKSETGSWRGIIIVPLVSCIAVLLWMAFRGWAYS